MVLDPASADRIVGFNPLAVGRNDIHHAVDGLVHVFKTLYAASWGPRSEDVLHASLLTLAAAGKASLIDIPALLTNTGFRSRTIAAAASNKMMPPPLRAFWDWFEAVSGSERAHVTAPLLNKLRPFTLRPSLAATLASTEPFRLERIFTERLVLLVPLRKGRVGTEVAQLFGSLLVAELWRTVLTRASISRSRRHPGFIYADEFQDYIALPTNFSDVLAQSRGLGVGWTLAHQNVDQLPTQLARTVSANAQNKVYFRLSPEDAERIARHHSELRATDLSRLPAFEAYAQILHRSELPPFASIRTQPLAPPQRNPHAAQQRLLRRWGTPPTEHGEATPNAGEASASSQVSEEPGGAGKAGRQRKTPRSSIGRRDRTDKDPS